ncbi:aminoacyl-tRNA hydrolase [bacterium]|nr:aminoacyl-tRNA hydrolase [bacterium]
MALFQRRAPIVNNYKIDSLGLNKTILLIGLGNVGDEFDKTRHNIGFRALDFFVENFEEMSEWSNKGTLKCQISIGKLGDKRIIAMKPTTFMNNSGDAVSKVKSFYKIENSNIIAVHDEMDINFGQIRIRSGGSSAGHNGIKSITEKLGTENYGRIRIGIGPKEPKQIETADFVLQKFSENENTQLNNLYKEVNALLIEHIYSSNLLKEETRTFIF